MSNTTPAPSANGHARIDRRAFVGSTAAFAIANAAAADAQTTGFGQPHAPIVADDDPAIAIAHPKLAPKAGSPIGAYAAMPRTVTPTTPGVVVTMAVWGIDPQLRDIVRRLAKAGFVAIAPDLYGRLPKAPATTTTIAEIGDVRAAATEMQRQGFATTDLLAGEDWIRTQAASGNVGITGFCMGGSIALRQIVDSKAFAAAAIFYGAVRPPAAAGTPADFDYATRITTPLLGSYGAKDGGIKAADVQAFFDRLTAPHDVRIYDEAGHAFEDDTRSSYVATAATDAWTRTLAWFRKYLS